MSEEQQLQEEAPPENVGTAIPGEAAPEYDDGQAGEEGQQPVVSFEVESKARDMGWRPREEWNGPEGAWRPADEFLKRGEEILPIVKSRAERAESKVAKLEADLQERTKHLEQSFDERMRRMEGVTQKAFERQRIQLYEQFEKEKSEAVNNADPEAYESAKERQRQALADLNDQVAAPEPEHVEPERQPEAPQVSPEMKQTVDSWVERNPWFNKDPDMRGLAESVHTRLGREKPGMSLSENLTEVERVIRKRFPEKFAPANHAPAVEGGGRQPGSAAPRAKGWNDLPAEAKAAGTRFVEDGYYGDDAKKAREQYAKDYWEQG